MRTIEQLADTPLEAFELAYRNVWKCPTNVYVMRFSERTREKIESTEDISAQYKIVLGYLAVARYLVAKDQKTRDKAELADKLIREIRLRI